MLAVVAFVVIGAGVALALSGKARRRVATGLGALAIVSALAIGGVHAAPAAQADAGAADCITPGAQPAADIVVTPAFPTVAQACYVEPTITPATTTGVTYTQAREGNTTTVTAAANPGYRMAAGATTTWSYDMTPPTPAPAPVGLPDAVRADFVLESPPEADHFAPVDTTYVPDLEAAAAAGAIAYSLDASQAALSVAYDIVDGEGAPLTTLAASSPYSDAVLGYDFALNVYTFQVPVDFDTAAQTADINAQLAAQSASLPEDAAIAGLRVGVSGLAVSVSWDGGAVCGLQSDSVVVDAVVIEETAPGDGGGVGASLPGLDGFLGVDALDALTGDDVTTESAPADEHVGEAPATQAPTAEAPAAEEPTAEETETVVPEVPVEETVAPVES